ncbi:histidine phosphatase family protein [Kibdelosporangium phytohabitans]|uniref:Phosphoglycerate kinase n=1 Tax=Kibdelosporangium phytohabitans TaxID=860235 RepID=A0A0N9HNE7_9PSEU|nr:histidine phosphatase family protein [Kibdelosporangium phytohabitans]ALG05656.1 phosphoglycerate kinase [Kibdelosporangium phytohabitans]MBE1466366.1 putative phosphoglycerate mutase [Kibdelosporangium phytohabitans]
MRLLLVRHGQTASNLKRALDTALPGAPLTDEGHQQAADFANALRDKPVAVYASQATRAQQTAAPIAAASGLEVQVVEGVHEVFVGDLEGRTDDAALQEFFEIYQRWTKDDLDARMPRGESGAEIRTRFTETVGLIRDKHQDDENCLVVLVSHGGMIRLGAEWLAENVTGQLANVGVLPNTGHVLLETNGDGWTCVEWTGVDLPHS